jgi:2-iminobutanoate/2-iminopropanoate deaminase
MDAAGQAQPGSVEEQTAHCLHNIAEILKVDGSALGHILKVQVFVSDIALWPRINAEYARIMGEHWPARVIVPCGVLHYGCLVEMDCTAAVRPDTA